MTALTIKRADDGYMVIAESDKTLPDKLINTLKETIKSYRYIKGNKT